VIGLLGAENRQQPASVTQPQETKRLLLNEGAAANAFDRGALD
jgi:hypothetical protein